MGRGVADVQSELKIFPFRIDPDGDNVIRVRLGERTFTPPEISGVHPARIEIVGGKIFWRAGGPRGDHRAGVFQRRAAAGYERMRGGWRVWKYCAW